MNFNTILIFLVVYDLNCVFTTAINSGGIQSVPLHIENQDFKAKPRSYTAAQSAKAKSVGVDLGELVTAVEKAVVDVQKALASTAASLSNLLAGREELAQIEDVLNHSILLAEKEVIRFIVLAPFLNLEQIGMLLDATTLSLVNNANITVQNVVEIAEDLVQEFSLELLGIANKLVKEIQVAVKPFCDLLAPLLPDKSSLTSIAVSSDSSNKLIEKFVKMIKVVVGLNIQGIMDQAPVTIIDLGSAILKANTKLEELLSGKSSGFKKIQASIDTAILKAEAEIVRFLVIAAFLNVQQLSELLDETTDALITIGKDAALEIQTIVTGIVLEDNSVDGRGQGQNQSLNHGTELISVGEELVRDVRAACTPLFELLKPLLPNRNVAAFLGKINSD